MTAYSNSNRKNLPRKELGYRAVTHQASSGPAYFDENRLRSFSSGILSTTALAGSTEAEQFHGAVPVAPAPSNGHAPEAHV